jgi:hypothetical protein
MSIFNISPSFLIIGAQKAATSSLYTYLIQHPSVVPPKQKEVNFFNIDSNYKQGESYYQNQFHKYYNPFKKHITFEATPEYLYLPSVPERIHEFNKDIKLIIVFREPTERAYSAWNMFKRIYAGGKTDSVLEQSYIDGIPNNLKSTLFGEVFPSFEEVIALEKSYIEAGNEFIEPSFLRRGLYAEQVLRYFEYFDKEQFLFLEHREISDDLIPTLNKILRFIGQEEYHWEKLNQNIANKGNYETKSLAILDELKTYYAPHNEKLYKLINREFDWNNK